MSEMEMFYGVFEKSDVIIEPEDTDDFYDLEQEHGCYYVKVCGQLYYFIEVEQIDYYGFSTVLKPQDKGIPFIACWYNGGAGVHEVVEGLIERYLKNGS